MVTVLFHSAVVHRMDAADSPESKLDQLLEEKVHLLEDVAAQVEALHKNARVGFEEVYDARQELERARLDLCKTDPARLEVLERMLVQAKERERQAKAATAIGLHEKIKAQVDRLDIEISLERIRSK